MSRIKTGMIYSNVEVKELILVSGVDGDVVHGKYLDIESGEIGPVTIKDRYLSLEPISNDEVIKVYLNILGKLRDFFGIVLSSH
jgi:hypothetical protein